MKFAAHKGSWQGPSVGDLPRPSMWCNQPGTSTTRSISTTSTATDIWDSFPFDTIRYATKSRQGNSCPRATCSLQVPRGKHFSAKRYPCQPQCRNIIYLQPCQVSSKHHAAKKALQPWQPLEQGLLNVQSWSCPGGCSIHLQ